MLLIDVPNLISVVFVGDSHFTSLDCRNGTKYQSVASDLIFMTALAGNDTFNIWHLSGSFHKPLNSTSLSQDLHAFKQAVKTIFDISPFGGGA